MKNAKDEFLSLIHTKSLVKCAEIFVEDDDYHMIVKASLPIGYTTEDLNEFLNNLDYVYENGYGSQELFGTVWFIDGTWADRDKYDGAEWWEYRSCPKIPVYLNKESNE